MGNRLERLIYTTLLLLSISAAASAQPFRKLTTDDFRGAPNPGNTLEVAITNCSIEYSYKAKRENDYYVLSFDIKLIMNTGQSWMDWHKINTPAMRAEILKHEQGHYNIAYLEQQELLKTVSHTVFRGDYKYVANNIFDRIDAKYRQLNLDYDADTQNSINRIQQHSWDTYFDRVLSSMLGNRHYLASASNDGEAIAEDR